ncbi:MAG: enolase C-terminal domain-like protein [Burkholderiaceae bacterium]
MMPAYEECGLGWLEEPFPAHDHRDYKIAAPRLRRVPLAAGENHFTCFEFTRLIEDGGGALRLNPISPRPAVSPSPAHRRDAVGLEDQFQPAHSLTGINMAASIHMLAAVDNPGYFEGDMAGHNPFRDHLGGVPYEVAADGTVRPLEKRSGSR